MLRWGGKHTLCLATGLAALVFGLRGLPSVFAAEASPEQKTAEQTFKNIQALKGLPDSQIPAVMGYMEAAIGAKGCDTCHVRSGDGPPEWEKDDKPMKQTARKMIQMVLDINKGIFNGRLEVTCWTCHQGHEHPAAVPQLPRTQADSEPQPRQRGGETTAPEQILDRYMQAVGGQAAAEKFASLFLSGTQTGQDGTPMPLEIYRKSPGKTLSKVTSKQQGVISQGFDGTVGWMQSQRGMRDLSPGELERLKDQEGIYDVIKIKQPLTGLRSAGREKIGEKDAIVLRGAGADNKMRRLFFDAESGLLLREVVLTPSMVGIIPEQHDFEDYRDVDGAKLAFTVRVSGLDGRGSWVRKFNEIRHDAAIDDLKFSKPGEKAN